jgi:hypothetical protein
MCLFVCPSCALRHRFGLATLQEVQGWDPSEVLEKLKERASEAGLVFGGKLSLAEEKMLELLLQLDPMQRLNAMIVEGLKRMSHAESLYRCVRDQK